jgi:ribose 5-phosphate isomerase
MPIDILAQIGYVGTFKTSTDVRYMAHEAKSGVVAPLQRLVHLWRAYEGPERYTHESEFSEATGVVVAGVFRKNALKMFFVEHDHKVRALVPRRPD